MNALPALGNLAHAAWPVQPALAPAVDAAAPRTIPFTELENISPGILAQPLDNVGSAPGSFEKTVRGFVGEVNEKQAAAGTAVQGLVSGQNVSLHQTMIALEEASISFQLMVEVRNKLLESYQELMRMQV